MSLLAQWGSTQRLTPVLDVTGGGGSVPNTLRKFFFDLIEAKPNVQPIPNPQSLGFTRDVRSVSDWNFAIANALPGDVIRLRSNIPSVLRYIGSEPGSLGNGTAPNGTEQAPITITADEGVWIDPGAPTVAHGALDIIKARHVHVVGVNTRNSRFGIRVITSGGTAGFPMKVHHNECTNHNEAMIYYGSLTDANDIADGYVSIKYNTVHGSTGNVAFAEGIYIGSGTTTSGESWIADKSHDIEIAFNHIYGQRGDGIDIKPGTYNVFVHHNNIHDCATDMGGGISAAIPNSAFPADPTPTTLRPIHIYANWIWNIGYAFNGVSGSAYGIRCNMGGMLVYNNVLWGFAVKGGSNTRGIDASIYQNVPTYSSLVFNNTVWVDDAITNDTSGGTFTHNFLFFENLTADGSLSQADIDETEFIGPVPVLNPTSDAVANASANAGFGPGSAFLLDSASANIDAVVFTDSSRTVDASGVPVPQGSDPDRGAYEYIP